MTPTEAEIAAWFDKRVAKKWFTAPVEALADNDEILVTGTLPADADVASFREESRGRRMEIALDAERLFSRKVSWAVRHGDRTYGFTALNVPVMTRLRLPERRLLDTLVDGGVARSRSDALAWCARLVATHEADWLADLEEALGAVRKVRKEGPASA